MKNSLFLLAGAAALSLASCSSNTTETTSTTTAPADSTGMAATTTTTKTVSDETYHMRGNRMADKFASKNHITDKATIEKLRTAYYNRSKRYDELMARYQTDTAGMAMAKRDYMKANDQEFQTILVVPVQYQAYQSSQSDYDEASNLDTTDQTAAASSATQPMDSSSTTTTTTTTTGGSDMGSGAMVEKGKTKMSDGSKVKVKDDGTVKVKDADGNKTKM